MKLYLVLVLFTPLAIADHAVAGHFEKLSILKRETLLTASAIRSIGIRSLQSKLQLASMANNFIFGISDAITLLNNVIPNILTDVENKAMRFNAKFLNGFVNDVQNAIDGDLCQLREELAVTLETFYQLIIRFEKTFKGTFDHFANVQNKRKRNIVIFAIYKLKYQAIYFDKPIKDLVLEMIRSVTQLSKTVDSLTSIHQVSDFSQLASYIFARSVYNLGNWIEVNYNRVDELQVLQEVSIALSKLSKSRMQSGNWKYKIMAMCLESLEVWVKLAVLEYPNNTGGEEFVRGVLFDIIAFWKTYAENLKDALSLGDGGYCEAKFYHNYDVFLSLVRVQEISFRYNKYLQEDV